MREEDERREQQRQHCNFVVFLNASQAAVLFSSSPAERGEERRLQPCVGGRGEEAHHSETIRSAPLAPPSPPQPSRASSLKALPSSDDAAQSTQRSEVKRCKCERGLPPNPLPKLMGVFVPSGRNQAAHLAAAALIRTTATDNSSAPTEAKG